MGITIHYKGRLRQATDLPRFMEEVEDIANILGWPYDVFETEFPKNEFVSPADNKEYGLIITPEDCEPIILVFDSEGRIFNPILKEMFNQGVADDIKVITIQIDLNEDELVPVIKEDSHDGDHMDVIYSISVKTQFAGADTHLKLVELLRYLGDKYFENFKLIDESDYAKNKDSGDLSEKLSGINHLIEAFQKSMEGREIESPEDFLKFLKAFRLQIKKNRIDDSEE